MLVTSSPPHHIFPVPTNKQLLLPENAFQK